MLIVRILKIRVERKTKHFFVREEVHQPDSAKMFLERQSSEIKFKIQSIPEHGKG